MLVVVAVVVCLVLAGTYSGVISLSTQDAPMEQTSEGSQIQILSPQNNITYQTRNMLLNISAHGATVKITYFLEVDGKYVYVPNNNVGGMPFDMCDLSSLDGDLNVTYTNPIELSRLHVGDHILYVYAFDAEGNVGEFQIVTFTIEPPVPPVVSMTREELQATIGYFESQELIVEPPNPKTAYLMHQGEVVFCGSAEEFADSLNTNGIKTAVKFDSSPDITFYGYGPTIYSVAYCFRVIII